MKSAFSAIVYGALAAAVTLGWSERAGAVNGAQVDFDQARHAPAPNYREVKISSLKVPTVPGGSLKIVLEPEARCVFGDLDAIFFDLTASERAKLVLSVEPLVKKEQGQDEHEISPVSVEVSSKQLLDLLTGRANVPLTVQLPPTSKPVLLGLYLCSQSEPGGRCATKEAKDADTVLAQYEAGKTLPRGFHSSDKIFYFGFLILDGSSIRVASEVIDSTRRDALSVYLQKVIGNDALFRDAFEAIADLSDKLFSVPIGIRDNSLLVTLPKLDQKKCGVTAPHFAS